MTDNTSNPAQPNLPVAPENSFDLNTSSDVAMAAAPSTPKHRAPVLYPNHYAWFVLTSSLDIMLTHTILTQFAEFGGRELNTFADWVIGRFGLAGAVGLKFISVITVVAICEIVGRKHPRTGRRLVTAVLLLSLIPIIAALGQLALFAVTDPIITD